MKNRFFPSTMLPELPGNKIGLEGQVQNASKVYTSETQLGWLPGLSLVVGISMLVVALSFWGELNQFAWAQLVFFAGVLLLYIPIGFRLANLKIERSERVALIFLLGLSIYLIKILHSPFAFTFSDELLHYFNAEQILTNGKLFSTNPILPSSAFYPGLEILTSMLAGVSGLSIFHSGLIIIGISRVILLLAMFLFFEQLSQSSYLAGLAVLIYSANPNYLYWNAQFAYESVALPIGMLILYTLVMRQKESARRLRFSYTFLIYALIVLVVVTHHITSFLLIIFMLGAAILSVLLKKFVSDKQLESFWPGMFVLVLTAAWLLLVGKEAQTYLYNIFHNALRSINNTVSGTQSIRAPFTSTAGEVASIWERVVGLGSVILAFLALPFGLISLWKRKPLKTIEWVLAGAALFYFGVLGLRLFPAAWEIANRASEFLFVGLAFVLAYGFREYFLRYPNSRMLSVVFILFIAVLFSGSVISGWPPKIRLAKPYLALADKTIIQPQGKEAALWMLDKFGPDTVVASSKANALYLLAFGNQHAISGNIYDVGQLLTVEHSQIWRKNVVDIYHLDYIQIDKRNLSWDNMAGGYLDPSNNAGPLHTEWFDPKILTMFDNEQGSQRIFDSGNIVIYDVKEYNHVQTKK
jgi:hypothetical protein